MEHVEVSGLASLLDVEPACFLRHLPDRDVFAWTLGQHGEVVVKRARERWTSFCVLRASAAEVEHANLCGLADDGLPVPRALGWCAERVMPLARRSLVVMERVEHAQTLRERLSRAGRGERAHWSDALCALVVRLHERGWYHRDLYLQHLVLHEDELVLFDVGRARRARAPRRRWFVKDLASLLHSAPRNVPARERLAFLARYLDARGIREHAERSRWLAEIVAKERRIAAHRPRRGEDRPWQDR